MTDTDPTRQRHDAAGLHGIHPMLYTFFDAHGRPDRTAMRRQVEGCIAGGVHGLAILGIVGEYNKLDVNERRTLIDWVAEDNAGRLPLAVTVNETSVGGQIGMVKAAAAARADWVILQPPPIRNVPESELVAFLGAVAEASPLPVAIQNNPVNLDVWLSNAALRNLRRDHPNVTLLKGEGPIDYVRRLLDETGDLFTVFNGRGGLELPGSIRLGCAGLIPAPECADVMATVYELMRSGDPAKIEEGEALHCSLLPLLTFVMANPEHMLCYGKRLFARRLGLGEVHPRHPCVMPVSFGMQTVDRYAARLPVLPV
jgi:2-keto-3-deoxy-L-arabinonate dehydratase